MVGRRLVKQAENGVPQLFVVTRRKGELSRGMVDRGWPHQIALPADQAMGKN